MIKVLAYLKKRLHLIVYISLFFVIVNGILHTSGVDLTGVDALYMNILLGVLTIAFLFFDFYGFTKDLWKQEDMIRIIRQEERKLEGLDDKISEIGDYLTKWVHEVKVPLSVARLIIEEFGEKEETALGRELDRINFLINQLLFLNRSRSTQIDLKIEILDLRPIIVEAVKGFKRLLIHKNISVEIKGQGQGLADRKWLLYILSQIIHNSYKYTGENGWIHIDIEDKPDQVIVYIEDNGIGVLDNELEKMFSRGFVGKNGRNSNQSTGFGLYLCRKVGRLMSIEIKSFHGDEMGLKIQLSVPKESKNDRIRKAYKG